MLKIEARRWVAVWYRCPSCGAQSGETMLTPWRWTHRRVRTCCGYGCNDAEIEVVGYRWYTTFCIEPSLSRTTIAGTLARLGPFTVCQVVHPNIRAFRRWYRRRRAERDEEVRQYQERERQRQEALASASDQGDALFEEDPWCLFLQQQEAD